MIRLNLLKAMSDALANVANPIKKLGGSERRIIDPLESLIRNTYKIEATAAKSRVGKQLAALADADIDSVFIRKLDADEAVGRSNVLTVKVKGEDVRLAGRL